MIDIKKLSNIISSKKEGGGEEKEK